MIVWWDNNQPNYKRIQPIIKRPLKNMKGGCDVERSFNYFSKMMKQPEAASMNPITIETRVLGQYNGDKLAETLFGCNNY